MSLRLVGPVYTIVFMKFVNLKILLYKNQLSNLVTSIFFPSKNTFLGSNAVNILNSMKNITNGIFCGTAPPSEYFR